MRREGFTLRAMRTFTEQQRTNLDELAEYRDAPPDFGDLLATVISGGRGGHGVSASQRPVLNALHAAVPHSGLRRCGRCRRGLASTVDEVVRRARLPREVP